MKPLTVLILIFLFQFFIYQYITLVPYINGPKDKTFNPITSYDIGYISFIRQAKDGAWAIQENRTTAPAPRVYAYPLFVFLGKISAITGIDPVDMYFIAKIVGGLAVFFVVYWLVGEFFPQSVRIFAIILILGLEIGPWGSESSLFGQSAVWRHFGLPHHTIGEALGLLFFYYFYKKRYVPLFIFGSIASFVLLPYTIVLSMVLLVSLGARYLKASLLSLVAVGIPVLFYRHQFSLGPPWNGFYAAEKLWYPTTEVLSRYFSSMLWYMPFFILFAFFVPRAWKKLSSTVQDISIVGVTWIVFPFLFLPILPYTGLPLANFRIIDTYVYFFAGVVAAVGFMAFSLINPRGWIRKVVIGVLIGTCGLSLVGTFLFARSDIQKRSMQWINIYVPNDTWGAIRFFSTVAPDSGVLALQHMGDVIADYAPVRVYVGLTPGYSDWNGRVNLATEFYSGTLTNAQARAFLTENDISYVFYGQMEQFVTKKSPLYPNVLTAVFQRGSTTVFEVQK